MYAHLAYILPTTTYYLTLPTLASLLPSSASPKSIALYLLLHHLPFPFFIYSILAPRAPRSPHRAFLLPIALALLLLAQALRTPLPLLLALPLLSFTRACGAASLTKLPVHELARADFVATCLTAVAAVTPLFPGLAVCAYVLLFVLSVALLFREPAAGASDAEEEPLLKPVPPRHGVALVLPLALTVFATASIHHLHPALSAPPHPVLLCMLCLTSLSEPLFQRLLLAHAQLLGALLTLCGSLALVKGWFSLAVLLLGCGGCAVGVCAMRDVINAGCPLGDVLVITGVMFAVGECAGVIVGGLSPGGWVWSCVSVAVLAVLLLREGVRVISDWGAIYGFMGARRRNRNGANTELNP